MSVTVTFLPHCQWTIVVSKLQGLPTCIPCMLAPSYRISPACMKPFIFLKQHSSCASLRCIHFRVPHWIRKPSDLWIPNRRQTQARLFYHMPRSACAHAPPHLDHLPSAYHIASCKASFQASLSQDTFSDRSPSPGRFTIWITLLSIQIDVVSYASVCSWASLQIGDKGPGLTCLDFS